MSLAARTIMVCALEPSADALGADLMAALRVREPGIRFIGCGGAQMAAQGLESLFPVERFAVIGPVAALSALPAALSAARRLADLAAKETPQAAVFIDSWSFSKIAAERLRKASPETKLFKYVAPQVWASRPRRAQQAAALFDGILCLFGFEIAAFEQAGAKVRWVGHPGFQVVLNRKFDAAGFRSRHGLTDGPLLAVLPGSRPAELKRHAEPFRGAIELLTQQQPNLRAVIAAAPGAEEAVRALTEGWPGAPLIVEGEDRFEACHAADAALAASGTATAELALLGTPMVVAYKVELLTELWARTVLTTPYVSLVNIAAGREVAPERLQRACAPVPLAEALSPLMKAGPARKAQIEAFPDIARSLAGERAPGPAAAAAVLDWLGTGKIH